VTPSLPVLASGNDDKYINFYCQFKKDFFQTRWCRPVIPVTWEQGLWGLWFKANLGKK
jgi:hypothetical protein